MGVDNAEVRRRRIVVMTDRMSPGGVSHFVLQLVTHLVGEGHQVAVISLAHGEWDHRLGDSGIRTHRLPGPAALRTVRAADVIHCQQRFLGYISAVLGRRTRTIEHVHNILTDHTTVSYRTPRIVAVSTVVKTSLLAAYPHLSAHQISVVNNGVRKLDETPRSYGHRSYDLVNVARFDEQKDPLLFLELVKSLSGRRDTLRCLWIAPGPGPLQEAFLRRRRELDLDDVVEVSIGDTHTHTRERVSDSRVFLLTSRWEGLPLSALEALASGTPVATTPCGEIAHIVAAGSCGVLLDSPAAGHAEILDSVLGDQDRWQTMSENSFVTADDYTESRMTSNIESVYAGIDPAFRQVPPWRQVDQPAGGLR